MSATLIHWMIECTVLSAMLAAAFRVLQLANISSRDRFLFLKISLAVVALLSLLPISWLSEINSEFNLVLSNGGETGLVPVAGVSSSLPRFSDYFIPIVYCLYLIMVLWGLGKYLFSLSSIFNLSRRCTQIGQYGNVPVLIHNENIPPATVGVFRPVIMVSQEALLSLDRAETNLIFAHELIHIWRRDFLINQCAIVLKITMVFSPFIHWLILRLQEEMEISCDDEVRNAYPEEERQYAKLLFQLASSFTPRRRLVYNGLFASQKFIGKRLAVMSKPVQQRRLSYVFMLCTLFVGMSTPALVALSAYDVADVSTPLDEGKIGIMYSIQESADGKNITAHGRVNVFSGEETIVTHGPLRVGLRASYQGKVIHITPRVFDKNNLPVIKTATAIVEPGQSAAFDIGRSDFGTDGRQHYGKDNYRILVKVQTIVDRS